MIILTSVDKLQLVTSAAATLDVIAHYVDSATPITSSYSLPVARQVTQITTATTTDIVAAPSSGVRNVKSINIRNKHASLSTDVTAIYNANATSLEQVKITLRAGETLQHKEGIGWFVVAGPSAPPRNYSTSDQVANAADTYITGSLIALPTGRALVAGVVMIWKFAITKTGAGIATPIWSLRYGSGVIGDTARVTLTGVAQTGAIDTATVEIVSIVRSVGGAGVVTASLDLHHALAATGFANVAHSVIVGTSSGFDTTTVTGVGVSVNPGSAGVWTITMATAEIQNLVA